MNKRFEDQRGEKSLSWEQTLMFSPNDNNKRILLEEKNPFSTRNEQNTHFQTAQEKTKKQQSRQASFLCCGKRDSHGIQADPSYLVLLTLEHTFLSDCEDETDSMAVVRCGTDQ